MPRGWLGRERRGGQGRSWGEHRIHEWVAQEVHRPLQLFTEIVSRELIAAEHGLETPGGEQFSTGPGQAQSPFVVAGVGHEIGGHRSAAQPGRDHGNHIPNHHDQIKAMGLAQQPDQPPKQVQDLPLHKLRESAAQARVADATGAELVAAAHQRHISLQIGPAQTCQGQSVHVVAHRHQGSGQQRTGEVFAVAIADHQDVRHSPDPVAGFSIAVALSPLRGPARSSPSPGPSSRAVVAGRRPGRP